MHIPWDQEWNAQDAKLLGELFSKKGGAKCFDMVLSHPTKNSLGGLKCSKVSNLQQIPGVPHQMQSPLLPPEWPKQS